MVDASPPVKLVSVGRRDRGMEHALGAINILGRTGLDDASVRGKLPLGIGEEARGVSRKQCTLERRGDGVYVATTFFRALNPTGVVPAGTGRRELLDPDASRVLELGDVVFLDAREDDVTGYSFAYQLRRRGGVMDDG